MVARKTKRTKAQAALESELDGQLTEVSRLLVRILKGMHFSNGQIVKAISDACEVEKPATVRRPTAGRGELWGNVLCRWMEDPKFVDEAGQPKVIPVRGSPYSFTKLVKETLPGTDVRECLEGLLKMNSVVRVGPSKVRLRSSVTIYSGSEATFVEGVLLSVRELLRTVAWNLLDQKKSDKPKLFQRGVTGVEISEDDLEALQRMVNTHGMPLLESFNAWVNRCAVTARTASKPTAQSRLKPYIGIYLSDGRPLSSARK